MGRPPIGKRAMTSTERSWRRRERLRAEHPATKPDRPATKPEPATKPSGPATKPAGVADGARFELLEKELAAAKARIAELEANVSPHARDEADLASLPKSSRERFEALVRRQEREYEARVRYAADVEARRKLDEIMLPHWHKRLDEVVGMLERLDRRRPIIAKKTFRILQACVQPDSRGNLTKEMLHDAAVVFNTKKQEIEIALCGKEAERPKPPSHTDVPRNWAEMEAARAKAQAENRARAKRAAATRAARKAERSGS
jgi:hypothetical protein